LRKAVENFKTARGFYPEVVVADPAYGSRENRQILNELCIRFGGKPLGKPKEETPINGKPFIHGVMKNGQSQWNAPTQS